MNAPTDDYEQASVLLRSPPGDVHLMGVGGIGMAGLARLLHGRDWRVTGCDLGENRQTQWLAELGVPVARGHDPRHAAASVRWLIHTAAVPRDHPEIRAAAGHGATVTARGVALAAFLCDTRGIAVGGTHGKTTTTAMIAHVARRVDPAAGWAIGGEIPGWNGVAAPPGAGGAFVAEADESDGTLALYEPEVGVITNVDFDHMEHFADERAFFDVFRAFAARSRGRLIYGADDPNACGIAASVPGAWGCGFADEALVRGERMARTGAGLAFSVRFQGRPLGRVVLPVPGLHNARNALTAIGAALALDWPFERAIEALAEFRPARRRLEPVANRDGVRVFSDYAHHPTEIRALLDSVADFGHRRLLAVFQPHRYSRTRALGPDFPAAFAHADLLWLLPVYAASEAPVEGGTSADLMRHFETRGGGPPVRAVASLDDAWTHLRAELRPGDLVLIIGAGDIERLAERAARELAGS